jgi:hypothetical protein
MKAKRLVGFYQLKYETLSDHAGTRTRIPRFTVEVTPSIASFKIG